MKLNTKLVTLLLTLTLPCLAQERGAWRAASKTAQAITGDLAFGPEKLTISFVPFTIAEIRPLTPDEILAAFSSADANPGNAGHLYRLSIPGAMRFLHKNTLCGSDEVQWMATLVSGKQLSVAFFSNATPPVFTPQALNDSTNLCGTYSYTR